MNESGGAMAKLLGLLLVVAVLASGALYVYGRHQQPLAMRDLIAAKANQGPDDATVALASDGQLRFATVVRNAGRLPLTLEGVTAPVGRNEPLVVTSIGLGDGSDPSTAAVFVPVELDPGAGIGVVIVFGINPAYPCARLGEDASATLPVPGIPMRFSSYGISATQTLIPDGAPAVVGVTKTACEAAAA